MLRLFFISILINLFIISGRGLAENLQVCVDPYPPFKMVDSSGAVIGGVDIELTNVLAKAVMLQPIYTSLPWARCLNNLKYGKSDLISGIVRNNEREKYLFYIEPPYKTKSVKIFYVNKADVNQYQTYKDLSQLTIGVLRNAKYFDQFDNDDDIKKYELSDLVTGFKMLKLKRIDAFITTEEVGDYLIKSNGFGNNFRKTEYRYNKEVAVYFALSKKSKHVNKLNELEVIVTELNKKKVFEKILAHYLNSTNK